MKTVRELLGNLDLKYPFMDAEKWDNIGLMVGSEDSNLNKVYVSLELTSAVLDQIEDNSTLITHHPLIFKALKTIDFSTYQGKLIKRLIEKNVNYIVLHTNYDIHFLNRYYVENILEKEILRTDKFLAYFDGQSQTLLSILGDIIIKQQVNVSNYNYVGEDDAIINKVAVCVGSGSSELHNAKANGANLLLTGDITYHTAIEAKEIGMNLIDISHFHSEKHFGDDLVKEFGFIKINPENPFKRL